MVPEPEEVMAMAMTTDNGNGLCSEHPRSMSNPFWALMRDEVAQGRRWHVAKTKEGLGGAPITSWQNWPAREHQ